MPVNLLISGTMDDTRADRALARLEAALSRIAAARGKRADASTGTDTAASARLMKLVNSHEKLREEVSDTLVELDALIDELEGGNAS